MIDRLDDDPDHGLNPRYKRDSGVLVSRWCTWGLEDWILGNCRIKSTWCGVQTEPRHFHRAQSTQYWTGRACADSIGLLALWCDWRASTKPWGIGPGPCWMEKRTSVQLPAEGLDGLSLDDMRSSPFLDMPPPETCRNSWTASRRHLRRHRGRDVHFASSFRAEDILAIRGRSNPPREERLP
jgi:hypothetical protein